MLLWTVLVMSVCSRQSVAIAQQNTSTIPGIVSTAYDFLQSHLCQGHRYGYDFHFYRPSLVKYSADQWLWDSGSHMIVWSHRNVTNSILSLRSMLHLQAQDGRIPEMIFWANRTASQERELKLQWSSVNRTDLTQMPVLPWSLRAMYNATRKTESTPAANQLLREFLPPLIRYFRWWAQTRSLDGDGLVYIIHGWESGLDASPAYDGAYDIPDSDPVPRFAQLYPKFDELIEAYRFEDMWDQQRILNKSKKGALLFDFFKVKDVAVNCVYAAGWWELGLLALQLNDTALATECRRAAQLTAQGILDKMYDAENQVFRTLYRNPTTGAEEASSRITVQSLFPLLLPKELLPRDVADVLVGHIRNTSEFAAPFPIPSVSMASPSFVPNFSEKDDLMWRGPSWAFTTWFVLEGLHTHGYSDTATEVLQGWIKAVRHAGIWEMYNPINGSGMGVEGLGMSTLIVDWLYRHGLVR
eukprot:m.339563 g.339563  ORF g.339563 m.339563 type:complete len:470 (-) comp20584_c0_seq17:969-2378(-)